MLSSLGHVSRLGETFFMDHQSIPFPSWLPGGSYFGDGQGQPLNMMLQNSYSTFYAGSNHLSYRGNGNPGLPWGRNM